MNFFSFGNGQKAFVILPGASVKSVLLSSELIAACYAEFTDKYTVYVFDYASVIAGECSIKELADATAEAMRQQGIEQADILGCSMGGMVAQYVAIRHPELVHKLVLGSTISRNNDISRDSLSSWREFAKCGDAVSLNRCMFGRIYSEAYYRQYEEAFLSMENDGSPEELERFFHAVGACLGMDSYDELGKISCPVMVIGSLEDKTLSPLGSLELAEKLKCEKYMYSGYSHAVYDEAPDYRGRLLDFFEE